MGRGCVDQIFTPNQKREKAREKKRRVFVCFIDLEKAYDRVNREALWQVLRMWGAKLCLELRVYMLIVQLASE